MQDTRHGSAIFVLGARAVARLFCNDELAPCLCNGDSSTTLRMTRENCSVPDGFLRKALRAHRNFEAAPRHYPKKSRCNFAGTPFLLGHTLVIINFRQEEVQDARHGSAIFVLGARADARDNPLSPPIFGGQLPLLRGASMGKAEPSFCGEEREGCLCKGDVSTALRMTRYTSNARTGQGG